MPRAVGRGGVDPGEWSPGAAGRPCTSGKGEGDHRPGTRRARYGFLLGRLISFSGMAERRAQTMSVKRGPSRTYRSGRRTLEPAIARVFSWSARIIRPPHGPNASTGLGRQSSAHSSLPHLHLLGTEARSMHREEQAASRCGRPRSSPPGLDPSTAPNGSSLDRTGCHCRCRCNEQRASVRQVPAPAFRCLVSTMDTSPAP